jgi:hypothetical protein
LRNVDYLTLDARVEFLDLRNDPLTRYEVIELLAKLVDAAKDPDGTDHEKIHRVGVEYVYIFELSHCAVFYMIPSKEPFSQSVYAVSFCRDHNIGNLGQVIALKRAQLVFGGT